eukprot:1157574-Pelagomonas_calceolata.AAC.2
MESHAHFTHDRALIGNASLINHYLALFLLTMDGLDLLHPPTLKPETNVCGSLERGWANWAS